MKARSQRKKPNRKPSKRSATKHFKFFDLNRVPAKSCQGLERPLEFWERHAGPQLASARQLLETTALKMGELERLPSFARQNLDAVKLCRMVNRLLRLLSVNLESARSNFQDAIPLFVEMTRKICRTLERMNSNTKTRDALKSAASRQADWPIMLSRQKNSRREAADYLKSLGVGTCTPIPKAGKNTMSEDVCWNQCAAELIQTIERYRDLRISRNAGTPLTIPGFSGLTDDLRRRLLLPALEAADRWPQIDELPQPLNSSSCKAWWKVARLILKADLETNPRKASELCESASKAAAQEIEKQQTIVFREVGQAFKKIARSRDVDED